MDTLVIHREAVGTTDAKFPAWVRFVVRRVTHSWHINEFDFIRRHRRSNRADSINITWNCPRTGSTCLRHSVPIRNISAAAVVSKKVNHTLWCGKSVSYSQIKSFSSRPSRTSHPNVIFTKSRTSALIGAEPVETNSTFPPKRA